MYCYFYGVTLQQEHEIASFCPKYVIGNEKGRNVIGTKGLQAPFQNTKYDVHKTMLVLVLSQSSIIMYDEKPTINVLQTNIVILYCCITRLFHA